MKAHIQNKRSELIWALSLQDYSYSEIGEVFKLNSSTIMRIVNQKPKNWKPKWIKSI
jgi:DNA-directed RNA polymerase specialized sigma24 family protein